MKTLEQAIEVAKKALEFQKKIGKPEWWHDMIIFRDKYTGEIRIMGREDFEGTSPDNGFLPKGNKPEGTILAVLKVDGTLIKSGE